MPLQLTMPPATEPVTLQQAKTWLKVETDDEDTLIASLIPAARARAEWHTGRAFITQGWTLWLDSAAAEIEIPLPPLRAVTSVTLYRADGGEELLDAGGYTVGVPGSRLVFRSPPTGLRAVNGIAIAFTCGYGAAADVPAPIAGAILMLLAALYEHRGDDAAPSPDNALALLAPYRGVRL